MRRLKFCFLLLLITTILMFWCLYNARKGTTVEEVVLTSSVMLNQRPIIGVVAQEFFQPSPERQTYIAASYIKFLEAAGARVAPILINKTDDEYKALFESINGILFPGGQAELFSSTGYGGVTKLLFQLAIEANDRGDYFPVWGTCLGFQQMACLIGNKDVLSKEEVQDVALPLNFTQEATESRMFKDFPADVLQDLATEPLTTNLHSFMVTMQTYKELESLNTFYRVLTTNTYKGDTFISTMEAYKYPFYGVQWHPEKNQFEWSKSYIPHSPSAVRATYSFADFFVNEGVVAQECRKPTPDRQTYIAASYVKYLEAAGARVAPILINQTEDEYRALFMSINGLLFPGGLAKFRTSGYGRVIRLLFQLAREANDRGDFFPLWGTCLGFQYMLRVIGDTAESVLTNNAKASNVALPLDFTEEAKESRMFRSVPADTFHALVSEPLTANQHNWSVTMETYDRVESLNNFYRVLSTNTYTGKTFISTVEAYKYPFYGVQWHPEKNQFEWSKSYIPHSPSAVRAAYYFADFFVNEARKNFHRFNSEEEEKNSLIYNWTPTHSVKCSAFQQTYFF